jgi:hypothetical protein
MALFRSAEKDFHSERGHGYHQRLRGSECEPDHQRTDANFEKAINEPNPTIL